jgi:hypothetical protein
MGRGVEEYLNTMGIEIRQEIVWNIWKMEEDCKRGQINAEG